MPLPEPSETMLCDRTILEKINRQPKRMAGIKQLIRELGVHGDERRELSQRLDGLVERAIVPPHSTVR